MSLLVIDIGNSTIAVSVCTKEEVPSTYNTKIHTQHAHGSKQTWLPIQTFSTQKALSEHTSLQDIETLLFYDSLNITCIAISSVVPHLTSRIETVAKKHYSCPVYTIQTTMPSPLQAPIVKELGTDLFANAVSAYTKSNGKASITVDFGTALSFIAVHGNGKIAGVAIAPGVHTSLHSLVKNTALLHNIPLQYPTSVLGQDTEHALQSGILIGNEQLVFGICNRMKQELHTPCYSYATGGSTALFHTLKHYFDEIDSYHTMKGIAHIASYKE